MTDVLQFPRSLSYIIVFILLLCLLAAPPYFFLLALLLALIPLVLAMPSQRRTSRGLTSTLLPYADHPLFCLRRRTIFVDIVGIVLSAIAAVGSYTGQEYLGWMILILLLSVGICVWDLCSYAISKVALGPSVTVSDEPNIPEDPPWPRLQLIIFDAIFAVMLFMTFWAVFITIASSSTYWYGNGPVILQAYAVLAVLIASLLHAVSWWKELMARQRSKWIMQLHEAGLKCGACGMNMGLSRVHGAASPGLDELAGDSRPGGANGGSQSHANSLPRWLRPRPSTPSTVRHGGRNLVDRDVDIETIAESSGGMTSSASEEDLLITPDTTGQTGLWCY